MNFLTTTEMADKWSFSRRKISTLCKEGRIGGVVLKGRTWLILENTNKPEDSRPAKNKYMGFAE